MKTNLIGLFAAVAVAALTGCGGGGDSGTSASVTSTPAPAPGPAPTPAAPAPAPAAPSPAPSPTPAPASSPVPVATLPAGSSPTVTAADCAGLLTTTTPAPAIVGADMQAAADILSAVDPAGSYSELARLPATFTWWLRSAGAAVDEATLGTAIHETNHKIDFALQYTCSADRFARYFADGQVHVTGLLDRATDHYSIVAETYPAKLKATRAARYVGYVTGAPGASSGGFSVLLDELNAYAGGANFEVNLLSSSTYSYLLPGATQIVDLNAGGMVDFQSFLLAYLQAARLNHPATYATIQSQASTRAYVQFAWTRAERILGSMYPYSVAAGGSQVVPLDVLQMIYSPAWLAELDALGITHKTAADLSATYLR